MLVQNIKTEVLCEQSFTFFLLQGSESNSSGTQFSVEIVEGRQFSCSLNHYTQTVDEGGKLPFEVNVTITSLSTGTRKTRYD